jgi:hypothetical protein
MIKRTVALSLGLLLAGCAHGPFFWSRPGVGLADFQVDHAECFKAATIGYGIGSEKAYKALLRFEGAHERDSELGDRSDVAGGGGGGEWQ